MTFKARVEDYIGTVDDTTGLDQFLKDSCQEVMGRMSPDLLATHADRYLHTSSAGWSAQDKRILEVARRFDSKRILCKQVSSGMEWHVQDSNSIHTATNRSPVFWIQVTATDARLFVRPDPSATAQADITYVAYPAPANTDSTATGLPTVAEDAVVLDCARRVTQKRISDYLAEDDLEHAQAQERELARLEELFNRQMERLSLSQ